MKKKEMQSSASGSSLEKTRKTFLSSRPMVPVTDATRPVLPSGAGELVVRKTFENSPSSLGTSLNQIMQHPIPHLTESHESIGVLTLGLELTGSGRGGEGSTTGGDDRDGGSHPGAGGCGEHR